MLLTRHLALALLALAAPALAGPSASEAARDLVRGRSDREAAVAAWREAGLDPAGAAALAREQWAPESVAAPGDHRLQLEDDHGTKTDLEVIVPKAPRADGRYGLLVVLHGLRGNAQQLLEFARRIAPEGTIVAAPTAQFIPPEREYEDAGPLAQQLLGRAAAGGNDERRRGARQLAELGHKALFPHWWSYGPDGFALRAIDAVRTRWPLDPDRVLLTGYSMGGYGTWNIGLRYHERFAAIAPLAGGISRLENLAPRDDRSRILLNNVRHVPAFFVHGDQDNVVPTRFSRTIADDLRGLGLGERFTYEEVAGGKHVMMPFLRGNDVTDRLRTWLAGQVREAHPKALEHHAVGAYHGASRWLRIEECSAPAASVKASVADGRITVKTDGVARLTVFIDPAVVDAAKPVTIEVDGRVVHEGPVGASLEAVAASLAGRGDPSFVFERAVTVDLTPAREF